MLQTDIAKRICAIGLASFALIFSQSWSPAKAQMVAHAQIYQPPQASLSALGKISDLISRAKVLKKDQFGKHGATFIGTLPGGELYFEVPTMDVDDDGDADGSPANWESHPVRRGKVDVFRQEHTSYGSKLPQLTGHTDPISPFKVPYIVLPGGKTKPFWFAQRNISIGDGAMVIRGEQCVETVFADAGPAEKIGEMSVKAHQLFGEHVIVNGERARVGQDGVPMRDPTTHKLLTQPALVTRNSASQGPFVVIVFPRTSVGKLFVSVNESLKPAVDQRFQALMK